MDPKTTAIVTSQLYEVMLARAEAPYLPYKCYVNGKPVIFHINQPRDEIQLTNLTGQFFESFELHLLMNVQPKWRTILDCGAHVGNYTLFFSLFFDVERIIPFEVNDYVLPLLRANIEANICAQVDTQHLGIGLTDRETRGKKMPLSQADNTGMQSFFESEKGDLSFIAIDSLGLEDVDLMKIDCEAQSKSVLIGAQETIARCQPYIFYEIFEKERDEMFAYFDQLGYEVIFRLNYPAHSNVLFAPKMK